MENEQEFLKELEQLFRKYSISITGCGCCDSPFTFNLNHHYTGRQATTEEYELKLMEHMRHLGLSYE